MVCLIQVKKLRRIQIHSWRELYDIGFERDQSRVQARGSRENTYCVNLSWLAWKHAQILSLIGKNSKTERIEATLITCDLIGTYQETQELLYESKVTKMAGVVMFPI